MTNEKLVKALRGKPYDTRNDIRLMRAAADVIEDQEIEIDQYRQIEKRSKEIIEELHEKVREANALIFAQQARLLELTPCTNPNRDLTPDFSRHTGGDYPN